MKGLQIASGGIREPIFHSSLSLRFDDQWAAASPSRSKRAGSFKVGFHATELSGMTTVLQRRHTVDIEASDEEEGKGLH